MVKIPADDRGSRQVVFHKKDALKKCKIHGKTPVPESLSS